MSKLLFLGLVAFVLLQNTFAEDDSQYLNSKNDLKIKSRAFPCPDAPLIAPCECEYTNQKLYLDCTNVTSEVEIYNVFNQEFYIKSFYEFRMKSNKYVQRLDIDTNGVSFERMIFSQGPFTIFGVSSKFLNSSFNTLEDFYMTNSSLTYKTFPFHYMNDMPNLHRLFLVGSNIRQVHRFSSKSLRDLRITNSNITYLPLGTFAAPTYLYDLDLSFNKIKRLPVNIFPLSFETVRIRLDHNQISHIGRRAFYNASHDRPAGLSFLYLQNNELTSLGIESIPLTRTSRLIALDNNKIAAIAFDAFLYITEPRLNSVDILLGNNMLTEIEEFKWGGVMKYIFSLDLTNNPLKCGCDINWIVQDSYFKTKISSDTTCADGRKFQDLDPQVYMDLCEVETTTSTTNTTIPTNTTTPTI